LVVESNVYLLFSLKYFVNLKSIIVSSQHGLADEELQFIVENEQYQRLESFRIRENNRSSIICGDHFNHNSYYHNNIL
jgi:hypothetical protein